MRPALALRRSLALALLAGLAAPAAAGSLAGTPRGIAREPAYKGAPRYVLLAFGPEGKRLAWLVLDDEALYIDRNGNGDLTEEGERVGPASEPEVDESEQVRLREAEFDIGDLPALGKGPGYTSLFAKQVSVEPKPGAPADLKASERFRLDLTLRDGLDQVVMPQLAASAATAPIAHLDGPLVAMVAAGCEAPVQVLHPGASHDLTVQIGTQGIGTQGLGAPWAAVSFNLVPESVHPVVEITFPAAADGTPGKVERFTLDHRC
ncbi:MAG: hypothetical protein ACKOSS_09845 [Planctomycetia bacterium]